MTPTADALLRPDAWRASLIWTVGLLAFPTIVTIAVFRVAAATGLGFAPLEPVVAGFLVYGIASALAAAVLWLWARRRGLAGIVFDFRRLSVRDWIVAIAGLVIGLFVLFPVAQWFARIALGVEIAGASYGRDALAIPIMALSAVILAPFCEEILFRGLGVAYLRSLRWSTPAIWLAVTLAFAAIHLPNFGVAGGIFMLLWGGMVTAIRLWRESLSPGLLLHFLNNAIVYLAFPLLPQG